MNKKTFSIIMCFSLFSLAACSSNGQATEEKNYSTSNESNTVENSEGSDENYVTEGYIVRQNERRIEVVPDITKEEIIENEKDELEAQLKDKYEDKSVTFEFDNMKNIDEKTISTLNVGQKVIIEHDMNGLSSPRYGGNILELEIEKE